MPHDAVASLSRKVVHDFCRYDPDRNMWQCERLAFIALRLAIGGAREESRRDGLKCSRSKFSNSMT